MTSEDKSKLTLPVPVTPFAPPAAIAVPPAPHQPGGKPPVPQPSQPKSKPKDSDEAWRDSQPKDYVLPPAFDKSAQPMNPDAEATGPTIVDRIKRGVSGFITYLPALSYARSAKPAPKKNISVSQPAPDGVYIAEHVDERKWPGRALAIFIGVAAAIGLEQMYGPNIKYIRMYERPGKPGLMRMYRYGLDSIMVLNKAKAGEYLTLDDYLKTIPDPADRNIEDAEIRKAVKWYDEE